MLRLLLGRARTGKSRRVLYEIAQQGDRGQQILLVPEHASHVAEVDVCRACGDGASRHAEVLTFKLLSSRVLAITGGSADVTLDNGGKLLTLQCTLQELAPVLHVYRRPSQRSAFLESLLAVIEELIAYAVDPQTLAEKVEHIEGESGEKLRDIALIYGVYLGKLHCDGRDARDRLQKLEENLERSGYVDGKEIFLDGFSYFTGREMNVLRIMLRRANNVTVTILGEPGEDELFCESLRVRAQLYALAQDAGVKCVEETLPAAAVQNALAHVERYFFGAREAWRGKSGAIRLYEASDAYAEAEWVASEILRLVRGGYRFRDITVAARNLSEYEPILETVFSQYGVPLYSARRRDILQEQVLTLLLGALDAAAGEFDYEDVFRCLKTGLAAISSEECDVLENYALKWEIRGNMWTRDAAWTAHPEGYGADWNDESRARLSQVNALRERVRGPFARLAQGIRGYSAAADKVRALYGYLEEIGVPEQLERLTAQRFAAQDPQRAEELAQLWSILCGVMDQFVEILGTRELDAEEFARLFRLVLTQYSVGTIPAALDQVSCSEITRNDRHSVGVLFLLGANDGALPRLDGGSGVLKEEDRLALEQQDVCLSPFGMAQFHLEIQNLYAALAQPTWQLNVSYPLFDAKGSELRPSFVVGRIQTICPLVKIEKESADKEYRLSAKTPALAYAGGHIGGAVWQFFAQSGEYDDRLARMEAAARYARGRLSPEVVRSLYGKQIRLTASRIDKARACHFAFFMQYGLHARERTGADFDAPQVGSFVHDVMENTLRRADESGGLKALSADALHRLVRLSIEAFIERNLPDLGEKNARFRYLFSRLCESVYRIMDEVADELRNSDFVPLAFELGFGTGAELPAITVRDGAREVCVDGRVDRVDGWLHGGRLYLRVVDYKTGKKSFDLADLHYGLGMQMLLYLFALAREGSDYFGHAIVPAGVLYAPTRDPILPGTRGMTDEQIRSALHRNLRRSGMILNDPLVLQAMEHSALDEPCYLPVTAKRDKEGRLLLGGSLASSEQLGKLGKYVDHLLRRIARELAAGNIDADPYARSPQDTACTYCPFASACHFTPGQGGDHIEYIRAVRDGEFWSDLDETLAGKEAHGDA